MKKNLFENKIKGLGCPIVTPMYQGKLDQVSLKRLIRDLDKRGVDFFSVCMSSGEGWIIDDLIWKTVVSCSVGATKKPVIASILGRDERAIIKLSVFAKRSGVYAVAIPVMAGVSDKEMVDYYQRLARRIRMPIVVYNLESTPIHSLEVIWKLNQIPEIVGMKDSSNNLDFFTKITNLRKEDKLMMSILQGMDHKLLDAENADGYLIPLANLEVEICKNMFYLKNLSANRKVLQKCWEYNIGGSAWYVTIKAVLKSRGIIKSAEQVKLDFVPGL